MKLSFKTMLMSTVTLSLVAGIAQAGMFKMGISTVSEVFAYVKGGVVSASKQIQVKSFGYNTPAEARLVYAIGKRSSGDVIMAVSTVNGKSMTEMTIELIQSLSAAGKKAASEIPGGYRMNGEVTDAVKNVLLKTDVNEIGKRALSNLENVDGLAVETQNIGNFSFNLERSGKQLRIMTLSEEGSTIRLLDDISGEGAAASFQIQVGLPKNATPEQVQAIINAIESAL